MTDVTTFRFPQRLRHRHLGRQHAPACNNNNPRNHPSSFNHIIVPSLFGPQSALRTTYHLPNLDK